MNAKEKAKELFENFYYANQPYTFEINVAKELSKIAVNETLKVLEEHYIEVMSNDRMICNENLRLQQYYKSVLKEIDNI